MNIHINIQRLLYSLHPHNKTYKGWTWEEAGFEHLYGKVRYKFRVRHKNMKHSRIMGVVLSSIGKYTDKQLAEYVIDQYMKFEQGNKMNENEISYQFFSQFREFGKY